jgi:hypothetical protein
MPATWPRCHRGTVVAFAAARTRGRDRALRSDTSLADQGAPNVPAPRHECYPAPLRRHRPRSTPRFPGRDYPDWCAGGSTPRGFRARSENSFSLRCVPANVANRSLRSSAQRSEPATANNLCPPRSESRLTVLAKRLSTRLTTARRPDLAGNEKWTVEPYTRT